MRAPGVLVNLRAGRVRRDPRILAGLRRLVPPRFLEATSEPQDLEPALGRLRAAGVETLAIVGGDGTVTCTLTALLRSWPPEEWPAVLLLAAGTINTIPHSVAGNGRADRVVARLRTPGPPFARSERSVLQVQAEGEPPRSGMIFGGGAPARWLRHYNSGTYKGALGAAGGVARSLGSIALAGPLAQELFAPFEASVEIDGEEQLDYRFSAMAAGAVRHIGLGFKPFLSIPREGCVGQFHWVSTDTNGVGLAMELPAARLGIRPPLSSLSHASAGSVRIRLKEPEPFTIDGDLFPPARDIRIEAGPPLCFLTTSPAWAEAAVGRQPALGTASS
jgi:diacylglycerol kinase family enzyme